MMKRLITLTAGLGLFAATAAFASEADTDGDGMLSLGEVMAAHPALTEETFAAMDGNGDGLLDADEVQAATDAGLMPASSDG